MTDTSDLTASLRSIGVATADEEPRYEPLTGGVSSEIWRVDLRRGPICVKRPLPKLRVATDWFAPVERSQYEVRWLRLAREIIPDSVPKVLGFDPLLHVIAMTYLNPSTHRQWKTDLREGRVDHAIAAAVGDRLARVHAATSGRADVEEAFPPNDIFYKIRLEPYFEEAARRHSDVASLLHALVAKTIGVRRALVHGDVSPKNIMIGPAGPIFLDAEAACYGEPAFDLAFCLTHLLLKCLWTPASTPEFLRSFDTLGANYLRGVTWESRWSLEARAAALLPGILLARIDGKSPVEYVTEESQRSHARKVARALLIEHPRRLADIRVAWSQDLPLG